MSNGDQSDGSQGNAGQSDAGQSDAGQSDAGQSDAGQNEAPHSTDAVPNITDAAPDSTDFLPDSTDFLPDSTDFLPDSTDVPPSDIGRPEGQNDAAKSSGGYRRVRDTPEPAVRDSIEQRRKRHALIYVQRLTKVFPIKRGLFKRPEVLYAVAGVNFYIRRSETFGLVGESGCGKSTLGRCLIRLTEPTVGRIVFDGKDLTALSASELRTMRQRMQIVFQDPFSSLNPNMTISQIVGEGIEVFRLARNRADGRDKVARVLELVGLKADLMGQYPHELSGGQRQRVAIARALAVKPDFIVLDEPLSALDLSVQAQIINLLDDLQQQLGITLMVISHDLRAVRYMSHRMAVMYLGKLVEVGPAEAVARLRFHPYTRALFDALPVTGTTEGPLSERGPDSLADSQRRALILPGEPASPTAPPTGCVFFDRCPKAEKGKCDVEQPQLVEVIKGSHQRVACWHPHVR